VPGRPLKNPFQWKKQNPKLIVLKRRDGNPGYAVTQRDIEEWFYLRRQMKDAATLFRIKDATIRKYIELGCAVEPGIHEVHLDTMVRDANGEHPQSSTKLVVR